MVVGKPLDALYVIGTGAMLLSKVLAPQVRMTQSCGSLLRLRR
jgi:hypothetical protein